MGKRRNRLVGALFFAGFLYINAAERVMGVRRTMRDGEYISTKKTGENDFHGYAEGPKTNGGRTGKSDQPDQTGNQKFLTNSNDRYIEGTYGAGKYKANIFQKSRGGPPAYQQVEQDPLGENSTVDEVSNEMDTLILFESSSKSIKRKLNSQASVWPLLVMCTWLYLANNSQLLKC